MASNKAKKFYDAQKVGRHGFLRTSSDHLYDTIARHAERDSALAVKLKQLGRQMARLHGEAGNSEQFKRRTTEVVKAAEDRLRKGNAPHEVVDRLVAQFSGKNLKEFLQNRTAQQPAQKSKPTATKPVEKARPNFFAALFRLPFRKTKPIAAITKPVKKTGTLTRRGKWILGVTAASALSVGAGLLGGKLLLDKVSPNPEDTNAKLRKQLEKMSIRVKHKERVVKTFEDYRREEAKREEEFKKQMEEQKNNRLIKTDKAYEPPEEVPVFEIIKMPGNTWTEKLDAYVKAHKKAIIVFPIAPVPGISMAKMHPGEAGYDEGEGAFVEAWKRDEAIDTGHMQAIAKLHLDNFERYASQRNYDLAANSLMHAISFGTKLSPENIEAARTWLWSTTDEHGAVVPVIKNDFTRAALRKALDNWHPKLELDE